MDASQLTFGIEIETHIPLGRVRVGSYRVGAPVAELPPGWKAKFDCSIHAPAGRQGCEFVSPVLRGADGIRQVCEVLETLRDVIGAKVNASTGLHVHVGWVGDDKALSRLVTLVANYERAIYASTGTKRRERGRWCGSIHAHGEAARAEASAKRNRYHALNLANLRPGGKQTVEFRAFAGSTNTTKVIGYIRLCLGMVERAIKARRVTKWTAKRPAATSPMRRGGEGQTDLTRMMYQLGWTHGHTDYTYGDFAAAGAPDLKAIKAEFVRLAKKYDHGD